MTSRVIAGAHLAVSATVAELIVRCIFVSHQQEKPNAISWQLGRTASVYA